MISDFDLRPNLVACQFLPFEECNLLDEWIGRMIKSSERFRISHEIAKEKAKNEFQEYEDWLCQQADQNDYDDDVPF